MMQGAAVLWTSARQKSIALSSAEAEMVAMNNAARDARFVRRLHASIGMPILHPTPLMVDNSAAIQWSSRAKWTASRHISTQHFAVQDWKRKGLVLPLKVDTTRQLADICTKSLPHATHVMLRTLVLGHRQSTSATYDLSAPPAA
jgi:hypothetical protein